MSLLNDMLHDLETQKIEKQKTPLFTLANKRKPKKSIANIALLLFISAAVALFLYLLNKPRHEMKTVVLSKKEKSNALPISTMVTVPKKASKQETAISKPLVSYIEPLDSPLSEYIALQNNDELTDWDSHVNSLAELESLEQSEMNQAIKKVYSPLSDEEWHDAELNKALKAIDEGQDEQAMAVLQNIIKRIPTANDARENLAVLYLYYKDYGSAAEIVTDGLKYAPSDAALITIKARLALDKGLTANAIKILSAYRPSMSSYPDYYATLAAALQSNGQVTESGSIYKALIQIEPDNGQYWLGYAVALEENHNVNQAIEAYLKASQKQDTESSVREYAEERLKILQG